MTTTGTTTDTTGAAVGKVVPLETLGDLVQDGDSVAFGGGWFANHPMAAVRQLIRAGRKDLHAITVVGSVDMDLLAASGTLGHLSFSMVTLEAFGLAPNVRSGIESGTLPFTEYTGLGLLIGLEAQGRGVPFLAYRGPFGSDLPAKYPEIYATVDCRSPARSSRPSGPCSPTWRSSTRCGPTARATPSGTAPPAPTWRWPRRQARDRDLRGGRRPQRHRRERAHDQAARLLRARRHRGAVRGASHLPRAALALDAWEVMEYAGAAAGPSFGGYVDQLRSETEADYRTACSRARRGPGSLVEAAEIIDDTVPTGAQA